MRCTCARVRVDAKETAEQVTANNRKFEVVLSEGGERTGRGRGDRERECEAPQVNGSGRKGWQDACGVRHSR